jgi:hypothetical protein
MQPLQAMLRSFPCMMVHPPLRRRIVRFARSRFLVAAAALWLVVDFASLPPDAGVKTTIETTSQRRARAHGNRLDEGGVFRRDDVIQVLYHDFVYNPDDPSCVGSVMASGRLRRQGWWAPTSESYNATLMTSYWQPVTPSEDQQVRALFAAHFEEAGTAFLTEYGHAIRQNLGVVRRPLPSGYVRNSIALLCALVLLVQGCRASVLGFGRCHASWRIKRGLCPACGYDLRGRAADSEANLCPECGASA